MTGSIQLFIRGTVAFLFVWVGFTSQASEQKRKYYIYDNGKIYKSEKPNVYINKKGIPTLVINGNYTVTHHLNGTACKKQRANPKANNKPQPNKTMEAMFNSSAGLIQAMK